jgi:hypothetical protein
VLADYPDFESFVMRGLADPRVAHYCHFRPQVWFLQDFSGRLRPDFIGRFERLDQDFEQVARRLGRSMELPVLNRTPGPASQNRQSLFSAPMAVRTLEYYQADVEAFGYALEDV